MHRNRKLYNCSQGGQIEAIVIQDWITLGHLQLVIGLTTCCTIHDRLKGPGHKVMQLISSSCHKLITDGRIDFIPQTSHL